jgi:hypothetical protein
MILSLDCYNNDISLNVATILLHSQTIQIQSLLTTQLHDKSSNITPQQVFCSCFTY